MEHPCSISVIVYDTYVLRSVLAEDFVQRHSNSLATLSRLISSQSVQLVVMVITSYIFLIRRFSNVVWI